MRVRRQEQQPRSSTHKQQLHLQQHRCWCCWHCCKQRSDDSLWLQSRVWWAAAAALQRHQWQHCRACRHQQEQCDRCCRHSNCPALSSCRHSAQQLVCCPARVQLGHTAVGCWRKRQCWRWCTPHEQQRGGVWQRWVQPQAQQQCGWRCRCGRNATQQQLVSGSAAAGTSTRAAAAALC